MVWIGEPACERSEQTNAVLGTIAVQPDVDGIIFDPASKLVLVVSGDRGTLMSLNPNVDPKGGKIDTPIELGGKPEFLAFDGKGNIYVNLVDKDEVVVVDIAKRKVIARWPVAPGGAPVGMSIDEKQQVLFVGCRKPAKLIVMSAQTARFLQIFQSAQAWMRPSSAMVRLSPALATGLLLSLARNPRPSSRAA